MHWVYYLLGALSTLVWKWQRYCYESKGHGIPFWKASKDWFALETLGSKTSWGATIGGVWLLGSIFITGGGAEWLTGGFMEDVVYLNAFKFFLGSLAEMIVPAIAKKVVGKFGGEA